MKCPKCGYLGFEPVDRCRNCGYDFALAAATRMPDDLPMRSSDAQNEELLPDLTLGAPAASSELPLFGASGGGEDDTPLITRASPPRAPLAVRRATPEVPRLRGETRPSSLDLPLGGADPIAPPLAVRAAQPPAPGFREERSPAAAIDEQEPANLAARLFAAVIDLLILAGVDLLVVYLTMKIVGITREEFAILPKVPLAIFLIAQNLGYLIAFTAGGQTIGKMASGIKVVSNRTQAAPDLATAARRTFVWAALALPAGAGFLSALTADRRGLHDRLADTRVVRASA